MSCAYGSKASCVPASFVVKEQLLSVDPVFPGWSGGSEVTEMIVCHWPSPILNGSPLIRSCSKLQDKLAKVLDGDLPFLRKLIENLVRRTLLRKH